MADSPEPGTTILAIVGPTAVGKTRVAGVVAPAVGAEIISVDSMQVYRGMDRGTAKPDAETRASVPYHMLDVIDPSENFSAALYKQMADRAIADVASRGKKPMMVGGSGLYFRAVVDDLDFANVGGDELYRAEVEEELEDMETGELYELLREMDPGAASQMSAGNRRRTLKAIQVAREGDRLMSERQHSWSDYESPYELWTAGLEMERALLYRLIDARVDWMMEAGLEEEVRRLQEAGLKRGSTAGEAIGYAQMLDYLDGELTLEEVVSDIKQRTRNYAKRQLTWFRGDPRVKWFVVQADVDDPMEDVESSLDETAGMVLEYFSEYL